VSEIPNQAINSTFTPADPIYFRRFCEDCNTQGRLATMDQAGRSTRIIIEAANFALEWVNRSYGRREGQILLHFVPKKFTLFQKAIPNLMPTLHQLVEG
jgi:DNA helicase-2/ATP-dependent DNA helicase PcrA